MPELANYSRTLLRLSDSKPLIKLQASDCLAWNHGCTHLMQPWPALLAQM